MRLCLVVTACALQLVGTAADAAARVGGKAPGFGLVGLDGKSARLSQFRGKVVLLTFWASWCKPCKKELPEFSRLQRKLGKRGLVVLAISVDEDRRAAQRFVDARGVKLRVLLDPRGKVAERYAPPKMPTSYIVGPRGVVRRINPGFEAAHLRKIVASIEKYLPR